MNDTLNHLRNRGSQIAELAKAIRELAGDDDLAFADTLDGETDAIQAARGAVRMVQAMEAMAESASGLTGLYSARAKAFEARGQRARDAIAHFMGEIGEKTLVLPEGTVSLATGGVSLAGDPDIASLPDDLIKVTRSPDRTAIKAALQAGREVPGCALTNGKPSLRIRTR